MWVRGLKQIANNLSREQLKSHPMWVRGLKQDAYDQRLAQAKVAPHVGAWIETRVEYKRRKNDLCRTPCGCVD